MGLLADNIEFVAIIKAADDSEIFISTQHYYSSRGGHF